MIDNRCPSCRWRVMHEQGSGRPKVPCCHGGPPVTIHGDFPFCPEPPYDYCAVWKQKDAQEPDDHRVHQPDYPEVEGMMPVYGCPVPPEKIPPCLRSKTLLDDAIPMYGAPDSGERRR